MKSLLNLTILGLSLLGLQANANNNLPKTGGISVYAFSEESKACEPEKSSIRFSSVVNIPGAGPFDVVSVKDVSKSSPTLEIELSLRSIPNPSKVITNLLSIVPQTEDGRMAILSRLQEGKLAFIALDVDCTKPNSWSEATLVDRFESTILE